MPSQKSKCTECKRVVSQVHAIQFKCKCENIYCKTHFRNHGCTFDYQEEFKKQLECNLVKVRKSKVATI